MSPHLPSAPATPPDPDATPGPPSPADPPSPPGAHGTIAPQTDLPGEEQADPRRRRHPGSQPQRRQDRGHWQRRAHRERGTRRSRRRRGREPGATGAEEAAEVPQEVRHALAEAGLTLGVPLGRSLAAAAPRRALDAGGEHVVVRIIEVPEAGHGAAVLRRLAGLRALRHPGLVPIREVLSLPGNRAAVIMELIDGASLDVVLGARGRLTTGQLAGLLDVLGSALAHMHERGSVHGDVSAGNVVIRLDGSPVLVDLLGSFMESGTDGCAAPERLAGGPATAASDVYALAALLRECAGPGGTAARRVARVVGGALAQDPQLRPSARDLAARSPELGRQAPIELPDGARLAAGCLRAAARTPTRTVGPRLRRSRRRGAVLAVSYGGARPGRGGWGGRPPVRRRLMGAALAVVVTAGCWMVLHPDGTGRLQQYWPLNAAVAAGTNAAAPQGPAEGATEAAGAPLSGEPTPDGPGGAGGAGSSASSAPQGSSAGAPTPRDPGQEAVSDDRGGDMAAVVVALALARDRALMDADPEALAATTVPGSPAAAADTAVMDGLLESGEVIEGLHTSIGGVQEVEVPAQAAETWPGARAVRVTESQGPYTRSGQAGARTVPALASRQVVLVLVPGPWRVAEVRQP